MGVYKSVKSSCQRITGKIQQHVVRREVECHRFKEAHFFFLVLSNVVLDDFVVYLIGNSGGEAGRERGRGDFIFTRTSRDPAYGYVHYFCDEAGRDYPFYFELNNYFLLFLHIFFCFVGFFSWC